MNTVECKSLNSFTGAVFVALVSAFFMVSTSPAQPYSIDFESDGNGNPMTAGTTDLRTFDPYDDFFAAGVGLLLSTDSPSVRPLNLYNSEGTTNEDDDLQRKYTGSAIDWVDGNLTAVATGQPEGEMLFNLLIINKNTTISVPNDHGSGGEMTLNFGVALTSFGFDFVDMDASNRADIIFTDNSLGAPVSVTIPFSDFEDGSGSIHETTDVLFGNRHANRILDITAAEVGVSQFDEITFDLRSSGGIGALYFDTVPEPSAALLMAFGVLFLLIRRPRRG